MPLNVRPLSPAHRAQLDVAVDKALQQWAPTLRDPKDIVISLDRVLLFLKQNGGAATQSRQVASLAFIFGAQVVALGGWAWHSVSDDDSVNPSVVSADGRRALLVVDLVTELVLGATKVSLRELHGACADGIAHPLMTELS